MPDQISPSLWRVGSFSEERQMFMTNWLIQRHLGGTVTLSVCHRLWQPESFLQLLRNVSGLTTVIILRKSIPCLI